MARLVAFGAVLAFISLSHTSAQQSSGADVNDDRVGAGLITGGKFGPQSFSIINSPGGLPQSEEPMNSEGFNGGNTQLYPVKSLANNNPGEGGNGGETRNEGGQILIGAVINKHTKNNKKKNGNKQLALDAAAIEAIFGSNAGNTGFASTEKGSSNTGTHENILMPAIIGDNFGEENMKIKDNWKPETNVLLKGSANNENTGNTNAGNQPESKDAKNTGASKTNSGYNSDPSDDRWIWTR